MLNPTAHKYKKRYRLAAISVVMLALMAGSGCSSLLGIKREVKVSPLLAPLKIATTDQLISEVNRLASVRSIRGKVDLQFQDTSFAESGIAEKYRTADGSVTVQRPGQIYLVIQTPFIPTDVAQMTSDGEKFRIAVLQGEERFRRFVMGTNNASYAKLEVEPPLNKSEAHDKKAMQDRAVSVLSNLRPQHFTDALLLKPIQPRSESGNMYSMSESYQEEPDRRPRASKNSRVVRGYYIMDELATGPDGNLKVLRRFWFDRVGGIKLARMQTYDDAGVLTTDVEYGELKPFGEAGTQLPSTIDLTRPQDRYKISVTYQAPEAVSLNKEFPADAFVLQNKWGLPEVNLDAPNRSGAASR